MAKRQHRTFRDLKEDQSGQNKDQEVEVWYELKLDRSRNQAIQGIIIWIKSILLLITAIGKHCSIKQECRNIFLYTLRWIKIGCGETNQEVFLVVQERYASSLDQGSGGRVRKKVIDWELFEQLNGCLYCLLKWETLEEEKVWR